MAVSELADEFDRKNGERNRRIQTTCWPIATAVKTIPTIRMRAHEMCDQHYWNSLDNSFSFIFAMAAPGIEKWALSFRALLSLSAATRGSPISAAIIPA